MRVTVLVIRVALYTVGDESRLAEQINQLENYNYAHLALLRKVTEFKEHVHFVTCYDMLPTCYVLSNVPSVLRLIVCYQRVTCYRQFP